MMGKNKWVIVCTFVLFLLVAIFYVIFFGVFEWCLINFNSEFSKARSPFLYRTPIENKIVARKLAVSQELSCFDFSFTAPWNNGRTTYKKNVGVTIKFPNDAIVSVLVKNKSENIYDNFNKRKPKYIQWLKEVYGVDYLKSNINFYTLFLKSTPYDISLITPKKEAQSKLLLISGKWMFFPKDTLREVRIFRVNNIEGFQYKDRGKFNGYIEFEKKGKYYVIMIKKKGLTWGEMEFVIASLK